MKKILLVSILFLVGCSVGLQPATITAPKRYIYGADSTQSSDMLREDWWTMFGDTTLNRLVTTALSANLNLRSAASRIEQARANLRFCPILA